VKSGVVRFSRGMGPLGVAGGVAIAIGVPYVVVAYGAHLADWVHLVAIILSLLCGGTVALASALFGIAIPKTVQETKDESEPEAAERPIVPGDER